jgi:hypothetical protein
MTSRKPSQSSGRTDLLGGVGAASILASALFVIANRLPGLGYFDGSEYALHIEGGGVAHAPGYPLFTLLGQFIHRLGADGFLAQQVISVGALSITALALYATWNIEVGRRRPGFAAALAVAWVSLAASYYLRLFAILPEVFVLNVALMALAILAITGFHYSKQPRWLGLLFFSFGLGLCHHHTLALVIPGCLVILVRRFRQVPIAPAALYALGGFGLGCLPLIYLFATRNDVGVTYLRVHDFSSLLFVLLRKGYGTFKLSPLKSETDVAGLCGLAFRGLARNFNFWGLLVFAPLLLNVRRLAGKPAVNRRGFMPESRKTNANYAWTSPSLIVAGSTLLVFFLVFIPNCNLQLNVRSYQTIFLRFLTIPCLLLTYGVFKAALSAWDWSGTWGRAGQRRVAAALILVQVLAALFTCDGLQYRHCDILDQHVRTGFRSIEAYTHPAPSPIDPSRRKCAIFAQGDTLLMGIKYYNHRVSKQKCFIFSQTSLSGQFLDRSENLLAANVLKIELQKIESGELATHPEALLNLFLQLDKQGYGLFVFSVTDFTDYFGKLFVNGPFAYRPVGNILQVITSGSAPWSMEQMYSSYGDYVQTLEAYLETLQRHALPSAVVDSQANQLLILNLRDYAKFGRFYPAAPDAVAALQRRADAVQTRWLELFPRE